MLTTYTTQRLCTPCLSELKTSNSLHIIVGVVGLAGSPPGDCCGGVPFAAASAGDGEQVVVVGNPAVCPTVAASASDGRRSRWQLPPLAGDNLRPLAVEQPNALCFPYVHLVFHARLCFGGLGFRRCFEM